MNKKASNHVLLLVQAAMIAALYVALTYVANLLGIASQAIQVRFSEALTILPYFTPAAIPGLFVGCLLANILTGCAIPDIVFGSAATLVVPFVLLYAYGVGPLWLSFLTVAIREVISCGILGMLLLFTLEKYRGKLFLTY